ncbi:hypothetical protein FOZ62_029141, partial [Perkinsus olseni]
MCYTGSEASLVSTRLVTKLGLSPSVATGSPLCAVTGEPVKCLGTVRLLIERNSGSVRLGKAFAWEFRVVESLDVVHGDLLLGSDIISRVFGGLTVSYDGDGHLHSVHAVNVVSAVSAGTGSSVGIPDVPLSEKPDVSVEDSNDHRLSRHIHVTKSSNGDVTLSAPDFTAWWTTKEKCWTYKWVWADGEPPTGVVGSGVTEYSSPLTDAERELYDAEIQQWIKNGWMIPYSEKAHGPIGNVYPLMKVRQLHKVSSPIRPVVDARFLNKFILNTPGFENVSCQDKLRRWRVRGGHGKIVDLKKCYLQVKVDPSLYRYQVVVYRGQKFVITRMIFGVCVAPRVMNSIIRFVLSSGNFSLSDVDNYVDDLYVYGPPALVDKVRHRFDQFHLPSKEPESLDSGSARVLGLQLYPSPGGVLHWGRRPDISLELPARLTRRAIFSWTGRLTGHYPICNWLRPYTSVLKRLASTPVSGCSSTPGWDTLVPAYVERCARELAEKLKGDDPVKGIWAVNNTTSTSSPWRVYVDASATAIGVTLLTASGDSVEDACWLLPRNSRTHINVLELNSVIKGLNLAIAWDVKCLHLLVDSKTVYGWLSAMLSDERGIRAGGMYQILVQRRLCLIDDLISTCGLSVTVEWVPSSRNLADALTRAPSTWVAYLSRSCMEEDSGGNADADVCVVPEVLVKDEDTTSVKDSPLLVAAIPSTPPPTITSTLQGSDEQLEEVRTVVRLYPPDVLTHRGVALKQLPTGYKKVYPQLQYRDDGVLCRVCKLPPNDLVKAPLCPSSLVQEYVVWCHEAHGHPNWEGTWQCLRREVYFPNMAEKCFEVVSSCPQCQAAAPKRPLVPALTGGGSVIGSGPWTCIAIDTLTLQVADGPVSLLVCYDMFTKYPEVEVLHRKTGTCVTKALLSMFTRWGIPQMVRMDNGSELWNETTRALFQRYTIRVCRGSPGHPQSQGAIERLNRSLLQLLRKVGAECSSMVWSKAEVVLLEVLFYYRTRPSKVTQISPQLAM